MSNSVSQKIASSIHIAFNEQVRISNLIDQALADQHAEHMATVRQIAQRNRALVLDAIDGERERCARIVESQKHRAADPDVNWTCDEIARQIRGPEKSNPHPLPRSPNAGEE